VRRLSPDRDLERSSALPETSESRERLVRLSYHSRRDFNVTSLRSGVAAYPLTVGGIMLRLELVESFSIFVERVKFLAIHYLMIVGKRQVVTP
jgi:hypothetical protein